MEMQKMEQSQNAMNRLNGAVEELIRVVQQQRQEFNTQLIAERNKAQTAENKAAVLEAQAQTLANENEKLKVELIAAQNNTEIQGKLQALQNEADARANRINGLQTEVQNLNTALNNRKAQIDELNNKNNELTQQLADATAKLNELESNAVREDNAAAELQSRLDETMAQNAELKRLQQENDERVQQMQQTISQTTVNIDDVVAKLEKVLKENGTSDDNNR